MNEVVDEIIRRFNFDIDTFSEMINVKSKELKKETLSENVINKLLTVFSISEKELYTLKNIDVLTMSVDINNNGNKFQVINSVMRKLFKKNLVYVLTKVKVKKGILSYFKKIKLDDSFFYPSFLVKSGDVRLLVNFRDNSLIIREILKSTNDSEFEVSGYRYKKANVLKL